MKNTNKRGFTIVELVIVIAVIAILAAILIPTFSGIIEKVNKSSDIQLVKNLNTALQVELNSQGITGEYLFDTPYDAVRVCAANGYLVNTIVAKSSYDIAYCMSEGKFVLVNTGTGEIAFPTGDGVKVTSAEGREVDYFIFRSSVPTGENEKKYSVFAGDGWKADTVTLDGVGFDAGYRDEITTVNYANTTDKARNVIIRTNGGTLVVDSKTGSTEETSDKITHYGKANLIDIKKTAQFSYYEKGAVAMMSVKEGHIVLDDKSDIYGIHFVKSGNKDAQNADTFNQIKLTLESNVNFEQIDFSRDAVVINAESGTKVCEVELNQDKQNIYLYQKGIYEQIKVSPVSNDSNRTWVTDAPVSDDTKSLSFQIANNFADRTKLEEASTKKPTYSDVDNRVLADPSKATESGSTLDDALVMAQKEFDKKYAPDVDTIDIVFVIDDSSSAKVGGNFETRVTATLNTIASRFSPEKTINVGIVKFKGYAVSALKDEQGKDTMISYSEDMAKTIEDAIKVACPGNGSNIHSGIVKGQELLEASSTPDRCKFMILFTDCKSYYWLNENGEATTIYGYYSSQRQFNGIRKAADLTGDALLPQVSQTAGVDKYNGYAIENSNGTPLRFGSELNQDFMTLYNSTNAELINSPYDTVVDWSRKYGNPTGTVKVKTITNPIRSGYTNLNEDYTYTKYMDYSINQKMNVLELNPYEVIDNGDGTVTYDTTQDNPDYYAYHVSAWEKGVYKAAHAFAEVNEKYNCSVVGYVKDVTGWGQSQQGFASWLENTADSYCNVATDGESRFNSLLNNLTYQIFDLAKIDYTK